MNTQPPSRKRLNQAPVMFYISEDDNARLDNLRVQMGETKSFLIRTAVREWLQRQAQAEQPEPERAGV
jgi:predicted transcriptional regulator